MKSMNFANWCQKVPKFDFQSQFSKSIITISFEYTWFFAKNLSNFVSLPWKLHNRYCDSGHDLILQIFQLMYWVQMNSFNIFLLSCLCQRGHIFFAILQHFGTIKLFSTIGRWSLWISANLTEKRSLQNHFNVLYFRILILRKGFKHDLNVVVGS